jgi:two-component system sensor histidine kinase AtoS
MKKHVLLGLTLMLFCFITGGVYIVASIAEVTQKLENVVSFHQVEFLRQDLEHNVKAVQSDLLLQGSPHVLGFDQMVAKIEAMEASAASCLSCHHSAEVTSRLNALQQRVDQYMKLLSRTLTLRANNERLENARILAFNDGENLLKSITSLSIASADKISVRINNIHRDITAAKHLMITCIVLGPIAILLITAFFLKRFTGSFDTLLTAVRKLDRGDLDYRIDDIALKDEFRTLAVSFNGMATSLQEEQKKFESVYNLYQALFEAAGDAIMITCLENETPGRILSANKAAAELYGYPIHELLAMDVVQLVPEGKAEQFKDRVKTVLSGGWSHQRVRRCKKDGTFIVVDLSMGLLPLDEKNCILSFCRDVTEKLQAEEELQRANQMILIGQMAAGLAHEIKNPLAGIKVSLEVLADDLELQPEDKELFARIINEANRMEKLIKNLLNYARPQQSQFDLVDISQLLRNSLKNAEVAATAQKGLTVQFQSDFAAELPQVEADSSQMQQVFLNILLNAVDAMENAGTVSVATRVADEGHIQITVSDTGKGLSEAALEKIFTPFFTTKTKGTGLGLSICKRLIEQHGGSIVVASRLDQGTSFTMTLPLKQKNRESQHES